MEFWDNQHSSFKLRKTRRVLLITKIWPRIVPLSLPCHPESGCMSPGQWKEIRVEDARWRVLGRIWLAFVSILHVCLLILLFFPSLAISLCRFNSNWNIVENFLQLECRIVKLCLSVLLDYFMGGQLRVGLVTPCSLSSLLVLFCPFSVIEASSPSPQCGPEQPQVQILVTDWFLESWWKATSGVPGGEERDLASLCNSLQLIHPVSFFLESTYYLTLADAVR